jgi:Xaa-Pro aminopeptidase
MRVKRVDAFLVLNIKNIRYLTGFTGSSAFAFITRDRSFFFTDFRYKEQAENEVRYSERGLEKGKRIFLIKNLMKKLGIKVLGFESSVPFDFYDVLRQLQVTLTPLNGLVEQLRLVKDSEELQSIKEAIKRAEEAFMATKPRIRPGVTESAVALRLEEELKKRGCRRIPFDIIVASGRHSSMPHAGQTDKKLERGSRCIHDIRGPSCTSSPMPWPVP